MEATNSYSHRQPFVIKRRSYISLLETLIAIALLSILLTIVFGFFRELSGISAEMERQQKESFQTRYLESRLAFIFERIVNENESARTFRFYLSPPNDFSSFSSLIFTFYNEPRLDPHFSGDVLGRLYIDHDYRLCLAVWPLRLPQPHHWMREEILLENVANMVYEFYVPPDQKATQNKTVDPKEPEKDKWHTEWLKDYKQMPGIVKLNVSVTKNPKDLEHFTPGTKIETKDILFSFVLSSSKNPVHYLR